MIRLALVAALAAGLACAAPAVARGNGNALDTAKYDAPGTYQLSVASYESYFAGYVREPGVASTSFTKVLANLPQALSVCGGHCRRWPERLENSATAIPQGLAGTREAHWSARAGKPDVLASTWYLTRGGHTVGSLVRFVDTSTWRFRTVHLLGWTGSSSAPGVTALPAHAGGAAWAGRYLYLAATHTLYRFDLTQIVRTKHGPQLLPDRVYTTLNVDPYGASTLSSVSTDWTGTPALVTARYTAGDVTDEVVRWPLRSDGGLHVHHGRVLSSYNFWIDKDSSIDNVQGVACHDGTYLFANSGHDGDLDRARVGTQTDRASFAWYGADGPEDLYVAPGTRVYGNTEHAGKRYVFWRPYSAVL